MKNQIKALLVLFALVYSAETFAQGCWSKIYTGPDYTIAQNNSGEFWSWGNNGMITGDSSGGGLLKIGLNPSDWRKLYPSEFCCFGIKNNGTLWAWGPNLWGDRGDGTQPQVGGVTQYIAFPRQIGGANSTWLSVASYNGHSVGVKSDGTLWTWGSFLGTVNIVPVRLGTDTGWKEVSMAAPYLSSLMESDIEHCLLLKNDGSLWSFGFNYNGQLGTGNSTVGTVTTLPERVGTLNTWKSIYTSVSASYAIKTDGTLWSWGLNASKRLGNGAAFDDVVSTPTQVGTDTNWLTIAANSACAVGIKTDGTLWVMGYTAYVDNTYTYVGTPRIASAATNWKAISGNVSGFQLLNANGERYACGPNNWGELGIPGAPAGGFRAPALAPCLVPTINATSSATWNISGAPTPTTGRITLNISGEAAETALYRNDLTLEVVNMLGQSVLTQAVTNLQTELDLSHLPNSLYFVRMQSSTGEFSVIKIEKM